MSFFSRAKASIAASLASMVGSWNFGRPAPQPVVKSAPASSKNTDQSLQRQREGIPHGVSGAKLARKALKGAVGKAVLK